MSVFRMAKHGPMRRPVAAVTALTFAGFGFIAAPAFGADDPAPGDEIIVTSPGATSPSPEIPAPDPSEDAPAEDEVTSGPSADEPTAEADRSNDATAEEPLVDEAPGPESGATAFRSMAPLAVGDEVDFDILSINDFHGRVEADRMSAGGAVLACTVRGLKAANPDRTVFVSGGDNIGASTFTSFVANDQPTLDVLNAIPLDVSTLGNHEFDQGEDDVNNRILGDANFPYLAANIYKNGAPAYETHTIVERDGVKIAFIGGVTEELDSLVSPAGIANLEVRDLADEINKVARDLTDGDASNGEADIVIAVVHDGAPSDDMSTTNGTPYGKLLNNADESIVAVISGHTHEAYVKKVGDVWATQTGQYGENLGKLTLTYDKVERKVVNSEAENITMMTKVGDNYVSDCTPSPDVQAIIDAAVVEADVLGAEPVGEITADLNRAKQTDGSENRAGESTLGNAVADVQLWGARRTAPGAQIAFMNPGGLRTDLKFEQSAGEGEGVVTYKEAAVVQPFANTLVTTDLTGAQIKQVLEEQWQPDSSSRPFLKLGVSQGLFYTYDPAAERNERIQQIWLNDEPLDPAASYTVVANSFLASGGDNFATLALGSASNDTGQSDLQAMVDYFAEVGSLSPDYQQRAVGLTWVSDPDQAYEPGEEVAIDVSSMTFSTTEPKPAELLTTLGGLATESAEVDTSIVDTTDEVGRAQVRVVVPADIGQDLQLEESADVELALVITDPVNGTEVSVPVLVAVEVPVDDDDVTPGDDETSAPPVDDESTPPAGTPPGGDGQLPKTGSDAGLLALMSVLFVAVGAGLAVKRRHVLRS